MFARVQVIGDVEQVPGDGAVDVMETVSGHPGFVEAWVTRQLGGSGGVLVTVWGSRQDAELASERTAAARGGPRPFRLAQDTVYEVVHSEAGPAAGDEPAVCQLTWFDGPRSEAQAAADERAGTERIWPAVRDTPGLVRSMALRAPDRALLHLGLATGTDALDAVQRRVMATELLPGEDPALLGGPDRIDVCTVLASHARPVTQPATP
ncbi:MAG TPA: hypothetical protein VK894_05770 [Jiangellales bacterium]|nr:hypothetical protein [Jiangellales bacterium]